MEIVKLIGVDVLPDDQKLIIEISKVIRVGFLQQNAFHKDDAYVTLEKQKQMMKIIIYFYENAYKLISRSIPFSILVDSGIFTKLSRIKYDIPNDDLDKFNAYYDEIDLFIKKQLNN